MFKVITVYKDNAMLSVTEREIQCKLLREGNMRFAYYFSLIISLLNPAVWYHETWRTASLTMSSFYCIELSFILIYHSRFWLFFSLLLKIIWNLTLKPTFQPNIVNKCYYEMLCISSFHIYIVIIARSQFSLRPRFCVYMAWRSCGSDPTCLDDTWSYSTSSWIHTRHVIYLYFAIKFCSYCDYFLLIYSVNTRPIVHVFLSWERDPSYVLSLSSWGVGWCWDPYPNHRSMAGVWLPLEANVICDIGLKWTLLLVLYNDSYWKLIFNLEIQQNTLFVIGLQTILRPCR